MQGRSYWIGDGPTCPSQVLKLRRETLSSHLQGWLTLNRLMSACRHGVAWPIVGSQ